MKEVTEDVSLNKGKRKSGGIRRQTRSEGGTTRGSTRVNQGAGGKCGQEPLLSSLQKGTGEDWLL